MQMCMLLYYWANKIMMMMMTMREGEYASETAGDERSASGEGTFQDGETGVVQPPANVAESDAVDHELETVLPAEMDLQDAVADFASQVPRQTSKVIQQTNFCVTETQRNPT